MKICKLHNLPKHKGNCPMCNYLQGQKRMLKEREQIKKAKAEGRGTMEWCARHNRKHPILPFREIYELYRVMTGRVTA